MNTLCKLFPALILTLEPFVFAIDFADYLCYHFIVMAESVDYLHWRIVITSALAIVLGVAFSYLTSFWRPRKQGVQRPRRLLTLRINEIPTDTLPKDLECELESIIERDQVLKNDKITLSHHFLVRRSEREACGTVTLHTSISTDKVIERLHKARTGLQYSFDVKFLGITPLYEAEGGADVEYANTADQK